MRRRGRPVLGAISGLFLGVFVAIDLMMFNVHRLDDLSVIGLPAIGLVAGLLIGLFAPFGGKSSTGTAPPAAPEAPVAG